MFFPSLRFFNDFAIILSDWKKEKKARRKEFMEIRNSAFVKQTRLEYKVIEYNVLLC